MEITILKNEKFLKWTTGVLRVLAGAVFIFSGFVKAIDPWGTFYKINEYLTVLGLDGLLSLSTFFSFALAIFEFVLGVLLLAGCYRRVAPLLLLLSMLVMLPLTLYIAVTGNVADCGCFGDAVHLSNWATFWKNVVLTAILVYLLIYNKKLINFYGVAVQWVVVLFSFVFALTVLSEGYFSQPLLDFRPFKTGTKLVPANDEEDDAEYRFVYEKDGVVKEFGMDSIPGDDWNFVERINLSGDSETDINGLHVSMDGEDITEDVILNEGDQIILLFPDLDEVEISYTFAINEIYDLAKAHGVDFIGLTSANDEAIAEWRDLSMAAYDMYLIDDSVLKQIARGNPAIVYLRDGVIIWKRALQSLSVQQFEQDAIEMNLIVKDRDSAKVLFSYAGIFVLLMILLLAVNRSHKVFKFKEYLDKENQNKTVPLQSDKKETNQK